VLVVDDSLVARMELGRVLERHGWEVEGWRPRAEMWSVLPENEWSIVFVDVSLPTRAAARI
jgi:FixJ family two-component response regulator